MPHSLSASRGSAERALTSWSDTGLHRFPGKVSDTYRMSELLAAGIPAEDARFVLPNAATTKLVMTMNARELHHFFALRCCRRAQWEIRLMAKEMLMLARKSAPLLFKDAGPGCLRGACPEGSMTCGKAVEVRKEYQHITISLHNQDERSDS